MKHVFQSGAMWEGNPWFIETDYKCSGYLGRPCKHCYNEHTVTHERIDKSTFSETKWTCPRVVIAKNEAGHNSTGVCLDCILEAAATLPETIATTALKSHESGII